MAQLLSTALQAALGSQAPSAVQGIQGLVTSTVGQTLKESESLRQLYAAKDQLATISNPDFGQKLVATLEVPVKRYVDQEITKKLGQGGGGTLGPDRVPPSVAGASDSPSRADGQTGGARVCSCPRCPHCRRLQKRRAKGRTMSRRGTRRANRKSRRASRKNRRSTRRGRR